MLLWCYYAGLRFSTKSKTSVSPSIISIEKTQQVTKHVGDGTLFPLSGTVESNLTSFHKKALQIWEGFLCENFLRLMRQQKLSEKDPKFKWYTKPDSLFKRGHFD